MRKFLANFFSSQRGLFASSAAADAIMYDELASLTEFRDATRFLARARRRS